MPQLSRTLLRAAALTVSSVAALASAGAAQAYADVLDNPGATAEGGRQAASSLLGTVNTLPVNPFAQTGVNPLNNSVGSQVSDFKPVSTAMVTQPLADSRSVADLPMVGNTVRTLQGG